MGDTRAGEASRPTCELCGGNDHRIEQQRRHGAPAWLHSDTVYCVAQLRKVVAKQKEASSFLKSCLRSGERDGVDHAVVKAADAMVAGIKP